MSLALFVQQEFPLLLPDPVLSPSWILFSDPVHLSILAFVLSIVLAVSAISIKPIVPSNPAVPAVPIICDDSVPGPLQPQLLQNQCYFSHGL